MNYNYAILSQIIFAAIVGIYMGPVPTILVELFPTGKVYCRSSFPIT